MVKTAVTPPSEHQQGQSSEQKYKGVRKRKWGKWVSEIRLPNSRERIWLGSYDTAEKAARAFDAALFCLRGSSATFNFPNNPPDITTEGRHMTPHEIQVVAARFANQQSTATREDNNSNNEKENGGPECNSTRALIERQCTSSSMSSEQVESSETTLDWSFWNMLDSNNNDGGSDFSLYPNLDNMSMSSDLFPPMSMPPPPPHHNGDEDEDDNQQYTFSSNSSFLWNF